MIDKVKPLDEAIRAHVKPGATVFVGGFGQGIPFALGREIIRQGVTGLTLCRTGADILFDLLVAAGCADRIVVGWFGNPGIGISHVCRRAQRTGTLKIEETSNFGLLLRLEAAAHGVPFLPTRILMEGDGDMARVAGVKPITCPFTGEKLTAVPALVPDVALVHAHRADRAGNVQMKGIVGDTLAGARAAQTVICTVEEIVDTAVIKRNPEQTVLPANRVAAVVAAPFGSWPSYVHGVYDRDDDYYRAFDVLSRDEQKTASLIADIKAGRWAPDPGRRAQLAWRETEDAR